MNYYNIVTNPVLSYHGNFGKDYLHNQRLTGEARAGVEQFDGQLMRLARRGPHGHLIHKRALSAVPSRERQALTPAETLRISLSHIMKGSAGIINAQTPPLPTADVLLSPSH